MKYALLLLFLAVASPLFSQTIIDPHTFPTETNPQQSNFEFYSRATGVNKRATFDNVRKRMMPFVKATNIVYIPAASGEPSDRGYIVTTATGRVYYIDGLGNSKQLNRPVYETLVVADNDIAAALLCVPVNGLYKLSATNTLGESPGAVRQNIYGTPTCTPSE